LRLARTETARPAARLALLCFLACIPALAQTVPPEPDPLARIRAQAPEQACSDAEPTLCAEAAPKIIANAMGASSTIKENLRQLASKDDGHAIGALAPPSVVDQVSLADWAVAAFHAAGLDAHTESGLPDGPMGSYVVAEIRGREKPDEIVVVAAVINVSLFRDGFDVGSDAAVLFEAARDIAATGLVPRRTIRFVLFFGGGIDGCSAPGYVNARADELDRTTALVFLAQGKGHWTRYLLNGRHDIEPQVREALGPLARLSLAPVSFDVTLGNCTIPFLDEGVPTLVAQAVEREDKSPPIALHLMDLRELKRHAAIAGVTAFDVAEDVAPLGPRLSHAEAESLIKTALSGQKP
jgi:hypothetical protein